MSPVLPGGAGVLPGLVRVVAAAPDPDRPTVRQVRSACDSVDNQLCGVVLDVTGNESLARWSNWFIAKPASILLLLIVGFAVRWVLHRVIDRVTKQAATGAVPGVLARGKVHKVLEQASVAHQRRQQRADTMGSLLKSITSMVVFAVIGFMIIDQLGYNIAPLIASAGILGVAIGFGAQSLVGDFLSGIFMILEDQYGVGDVIDCGTAVGTVEAVGLRVTRIRDIDGTVWYVRNGLITAVGNQSQNWAQAVLDFRIAFTEDIDRVKAILTEVAREIFDDPDHSEDVLEEPEVWGVQAWDPDGVVVRVVLKTAPLRQWEVARQMRERVKERFDEEGVEIPLPQRVIWQRDAAGPFTAPNDARTEAPRE